MRKPGRKRREAVPWEPALQEEGWTPEWIGIQEMALEGAKVEIEMARRIWERDRKGDYGPYPSLKSCLAVPGSRIGVTKGTQLRDFHELFVHQGRTKQDLLVRIVAKLGITKTLAVVRFGMLHPEHLPALMAAAAEKPARDFYAFLGKLELEHGLESARNVTDASVEDTVERKLERIGFELKTREDVVRLAATADEKDLFAHGRKG